MGDRKVKVDAQMVLDQIQDEWEMSGLSDGMYAEYACEFAKIIIACVCDRAPLSLLSESNELEQIMMDMIEWPDFD